MPLNTTTGTIETIGTIAGYDVTMSRRKAVPTDALGNSTVMTVALKKSGTTYETLVTSDDGNGSSVALATGRAIVNAFAAIGGQVTLGDPAQTPVTPSSASSTGSPAPISRSVVLTPGTPLPAGRAVIVKAGGGGPVVLKLAGGGTVTVGDQTGGAGQRHDYAVVDADLTNAGANASVAILY